MKYASRFLTPALTLCALLLTAFHLVGFAILGDIPPMVLFHFAYRLLTLPPVLDIGLLLGTLFALHRTYRGERAPKHGVILLVDAILFSLCLSLHFGHLTV